MATKKDFQINKDIYNSYNRIVYNNLSYIDKISTYEVENLKARFYNINEFYDFINFRVMNKIIFCNEFVSTSKKAKEENGFHDFNKIEDVEQETKKRSKDLKQKLELNYNFAKNKNNKSSFDQTSNGQGYDIARVISNDDRPFYKNIKNKTPNKIYKKLIIINISILGSVDSCDYNKFIQNKITDIINNYYFDKLLIIACSTESLKVKSNDYSFLSIEFDYKSIFDLSLINSVDFFRRYVFYFREQSKKYGNNSYSVKYKDDLLSLVDFGLSSYQIAFCNYYNQGLH
jgi:hypothetical protein